MDDNCKTFGSMLCNGDLPVGLQELQLTACSLCGDTEADRQLLRRLLLDTDSKVVNIHSRC